MESDRDLEAELRDADRAAAVAWTDYPPTPRWYPFAGGLWAAGLALVMALGDDLPGIWSALSLLGLVAVAGGFFGWARRVRGTMPDVWRPPAEFRPALARYVAGVVGVLAAGVAAFALGGAWVSAAVVLVAVTTLLWWYERVYADAARRTRERLG